MNWTKIIETHYAQNWRVNPEVCVFEKGPTIDLPMGFKVLLFPPHAGRSMWTYATCNMSQSQDAVPIEIHLFSPIPDIGIVELLFAIAHFHRTGTKLDLWHTVNLGRSWLNESLCTYGLVSLPYLDGPELENLIISSQSIKFYWLIPITKAELDLKKTAGVDALETRFEAVSFDYSNPARASVV